MSQTLTLKTNIKYVTNLVYDNDVYDHKKLPLGFIPSNHESIPKNWLNLANAEMSFFDKISHTEENCHKIEENTVQQGNNKCWFNERKYRITSSNGHKVYIRKKNFETLTETFLNPKQVQDLPKFTQEALKHGTKYEPVARERFFEHMKYNLKRHINIRDTGIVIQPYLFWLGASPDGLIVDSLEEFPGLIEINVQKLNETLVQRNYLKIKNFMSVCKMENFT